MKKSFFLFTVILLPFFSYSQRTITGEVYNALDSSPLPGVFVSTEQDNGTFTDFDHLTMFL